MKGTKKSIRLYEHERALLVELYLRWRIPIDQFENRPEEWEAFNTEWKRQSGRNDLPGELLHYMRTQRKRGLWVRLEENARPAPPVADLSPEETEILVKIFREHVTELDNGSDVLAYDDEIAGLISKEFSAEAGRIVPAHELVAKLTALRKRGLLPKTGRWDREDGDSDDAGFTDIGEIKTQTG